MPESAKAPAEPDPASGPSVKSATRWNAVGKAAVMAIRWLVQIWLLKILAVEDFGDMAIAISFSGLLTLFAEFGTGQAVVQREKLDEKFLSTVFWLNIGLGLSLFGMVWAGSAIAVAIRGTSTLTSILPILAISFAILSAGIVQRNLLVRRLEFGRIAIVQIVEAGTYGIVAVWLALAGEGVWALVFGTTAGSAALVVTAWLLGGWRPKFLFRFETIREVWSFSINLLGARITDHVFLEADRVVIYAMLGSEATGFYYAAQQLVVFPVATITQVLAGVLVPALARLQSDLPKFREMLIRSIAGVSFVVSPILFGLAAVLEPTINGFLGSSDDGGGKWAPALAPALLLVVASLLRSVFISTASVYVAMGQTKLMFRWTLVLGLSLIVSYIIGAALFGLVGVAAGFTITHIVLAPKLFQTALGLVDLELGAAIKAMRPVVLLAGLMALVVFGVELALKSAGVADQVRAIAGVFIGGAVFGIGAFIVRPDGFDDLLRLAGLSRLIRTPLTSP